jgi:hypothetical protein
MAEVRGSSPLSSIGAEPRSDAGSDNTDTHPSASRGVAVPSRGLVILLSDLDRREVGESFAVGAYYGALGRACGCSDQEIVRAARPAHSSRMCKKCGVCSGDRQVVRFDRDALQDLGHEALSRLSALRVRQLDANQ